MWQDVVLSSCAVCFIIALIPQVIHNYKAKAGAICYATAVATMVPVYIMAYCMFTLGMWFSFVTLFLNGTLWLILIFQNIVYRVK